LIDGQGDTEKALSARGGGPTADTLLAVERICVWDGHIDTLTENTELASTVHHGSGITVLS